MTVALGEITNVAISMIICSMWLAYALTDNILVGIFASVSTVLFFVGAAIPSK